jgi:hypothetical protein
MRDDAVHGGLDRGGEREDEITLGSQDARARV